MRNKMIKNYKNNTMFGSILMIGIMVLLVGFSYAFFVYNKTGLYTHTITGGKMSIIYNETTGNNITINNAYPLTDEEALTKGLEFEFTITGYNESDKNIYYAIEMDYGEDLSNKERFIDNNLKLSLYENEEEVFENEIFNNLDNQDIYYGYIKSGTSVDSPITNNYKLRIWINDYVVISDTLSSDLSTWNDFEWDWLEEYNKSVYNELMNSDSQDLSDYGISIYTSEEFQNMYANFKVNVTADLTYDDVDFITYDANGGEFTPEKTSLTTRRVTVQKPVMRTAINTQVSNNNYNKVTSIENEVEYVYQGFLGWSSTPYGEVEYKAGDYYTGDGKILYAVYGESVNKMAEYWPEDENGNYPNGQKVYFINDTQENIDERYNSAEYKWDLSYDESSNVKGWQEIDETDGSTTFYVASEGTIYLTNGENLFNNWRDTIEFHFDNIDTSMVTSIAGMFYEVTYVVHFDLRAFNTSNVYDMHDMFQCYPNAETLSIDLSSFNTQNVTNMSSMFYGRIKLESLDLSNFNTQNVIDMSRLFGYCYNILNLDVSNFDTSNVTDMSAMFYALTNLKEFDLSNFDTSKVTNMREMFAYCESVEKINLNFDTSNVINVSMMFIQCSNLQELDLNNFNISKVEDVSSMFYYCHNLVTIYCNNDWDTQNITDSARMFYGCTSLVGAVLFDSSKVDIAMANPDTGYFTRRV